MSRYLKGLPLPVLPRKVGRDLTNSMTRPYAPTKAFRSDLRSALAMDIIVHDGDHDEIEVMMIDTDRL